MKLINTIDVYNTPKQIQLLQGDLTDIPSHFAVHLLVISAFPDDYFPTPTSLIGALNRKGINVDSLARLKDRDLRENFSCWLSAKFSPPVSGVRFERILCFEPLNRGKPPEVVSDIFRALTPILAEHAEINSIAMPILASGDQGSSVSDMVSALLQASFQWMKKGLPLTYLRIVAHSNADAVEGSAVFEDFKLSLKNEGQPEDDIVSMEFDVFLSYAHENKKEMELLENALRQIDPSIRIFLDRKSIDIGAAWQPEIFESLDRCSKVVALFSPEYLKSKVCKEEYNIAWVRSRETDTNIIFPLYIYSAELPTYMKYRSYLDCREGNQKKVTEASEQIIALIHRQ